MKKGILILILSAGAILAGATFLRGLAAQEAPRKIEVVAKKFEFDPGEITLKKGQPVVLVLKSTDVAHGLRFRELNVDVRVSAGGTSQTEFTPDKTGDFVGHCSVFCGSGHGSMTLTLHVVE
jgi:cytochrome c oxidase subunit II